jgi:hypothetical protein
MAKSGPLSNNDLRTPIGGDHARRLRARIERLEFLQVAAADQTSGNQHLVDGDKTKVRGLYLLSAALPSAGESMVFDVKKNGTSILTATYTYDSTVTTKRVDLLSLVIADTSFADGDIVEVERDWTDPGTDTITTTKVVMELE